MPTYNFDNVDKIEITIPADGESDAAARRSRKGPIKPRSFQDDAYRRKKGGILLNFWDTSQINVGGVWKDLPFSVAKTIYSRASISPDPDHVDGLVLSDWMAYKNKLFEVPIADWETSYRKIDYDSAWRYGIDVYTGDPAAIVPGPGVLFDQYDQSKYFPVAKDNERKVVDYSGQQYGHRVTNSKWSPNGLKIEKSDHFSLITLSAFLNFGLYFTPKITAINDYSASPVAFKLDKSTDFFLVAALVTDECISAWNVSPYDPTSFFNNTYLNYLYRPWSREVFLSNTYFESLYNDGLSTFTRIEFRNHYVHGPTLPFPAAFQDLLNRQLADHHARAWVDHTPSANGSIENPSTWPFFNGYTYIYRGGGPILSFDLTNYVGNNNKATVPKGALLCVARQKNSGGDYDYFHFWNDGVEEPNNQPGLNEFQILNWLNLEYQRY